MRALRRVLAAVVALLLLAAAVVTIVEVVLAALDRETWVVPRDDLAESFRERTWSEAPVIAWSATSALVGAVLLVLGLRRGRPATVPLATVVDGLALSASRRSVEQAVTRAVAEEEGVRDARARLGRRRLKVRADTDLEDGDVEQRVTHSVHGRLEALQPRHEVVPRVRVRHGRH